MYEVYCFYSLRRPFFISCENRTLLDENSDFSQVDGKKQKELANAIRLVENFGRIVNVSTKSSSSFTIKLEEMKTFSKGNVILAFGLDVASRDGHFWVIDGYVPLLTKCDAAKIHCNWGWGGKSDGWYTDYTFRDNYTRPWYSTYHLAYEQRFAYLNVKK